MLPDIYYIVLDGYARTDVMNVVIQLRQFTVSQRTWRNSDSTSRARARRTTVKPRSRCPLRSTPCYLDDLVKGLGHDQTELSDLIGKSNVVETLRPLGYKFVTFATGFDPTEFPEADIYLSPQRYWNGFERMVIDTTWLRVIWPNPAHLDRTMQSRQRTFFLLDQLPQIASNTSADISRLLMCSARILHLSSARTAKT